MTFQAVATLSNQKSLCIGEITVAEAESAAADDPAFDGYGLYLMLVDSRNPSSPGTVLAKFSSSSAALELARFFRIYGQLEVA